MMHLSTFWSRKIAMTLGGRHVTWGSRNSRPDLRSLSAGGNVEIGKRNLSGARGVLVLSLNRVSSAHQVRRNKIQELSGTNDLRALPETWKMPLIARNQVIGAGRVSAFDKNVIGGIRGDHRQA